MKAFLASCAAAVLLAVVAAVALDQFDMTATEAYSTPNARPPASD